MGRLWMTLRGIRSMCIGWSEGLRPSPVRMWCSHTARRVLLVTGVCTRSRPPALRFHDKAVGRSGFSPGVFDWRLHAAPPPPALRFHDKAVGHRALFGGLQRWDFVDGDVGLVGGADV
jgi:hypothetical protein